MNPIRQRIERNIDSFTQLHRTSDDGVGHIGGKGTLLIPDWAAMEELQLSTLRHCALYLTDFLLCRRPSVLLPDHLQYWSWTAAFASQYIKRSSDYLPLLKDFYSIVHLLLMSERHKHISWSVRNKIQSINRSIRPFLLDSPYTFAALPSFPTLEGLVWRHSNYISERGKSTKEIEIENLNIGPISRNDDIYLYNALQTWTYLDANPEVSRILQKIDCIERYDYGILDKKFSRIDERTFQDIADENGSFLYYLTEVRNSNMHGKVRTQLMGFICINLICLLIWDSIGDEQFELKRELLSGLIHSDDEKIKIGEEYPEWIGDLSEEDSMTVDDLEEVTPSGNPFEFYPVHNDQ